MLEFYSLGFVQPRIGGELDVNRNFAVADLLGLEARFREEIWSITLIFVRVVVGITDTFCAKRESD